jgi:large subunit ribosomal protein L28
MSRVCDICGRGPQKSIKKSHANNKTIVRKFINLQTRTIDGVKKKICTRCLRTIKKRMV